MRVEFLVKSHIRKGSRGKGPDPVWHYPATVIIDGVKFKSEEPMNEAHANYINETIQRIKDSGESPCK